MTQEPPRPDCPGCGTSPGDVHRNGCDIGRCLLCGWQALSCNCIDPPERWDATTVEVWAGEWPGDAECREYGWWVYVTGDGDFAPCTPDHPDAVADLNRLVRECRWDPTLRRYVKREGA